ncbi:MAG TPA: hypothetical protein VN258_06085 [Mobilitalea sp.]|nr:hypothetical protein [Mobilitalea sp.]
MKKKMFLLFLIILVIIFGINFLINKNVILVKTNRNNITSISLTQWKGSSVIIKDKETINKLFDHLVSVRATRGLWYIGNPDKWDFRISIYSSIDNNSKLEECIYLSLNKKAYKDNFIYNIDGFDFNYILSLLK